MITQEGERENGNRGGRRKVQIGENANHASDYGHFLISVTKYINNQNNSPPHNFIQNIFIYIYISIHIHTFT